MSLVVVSIQSFKDQFHNFDYWMKSIMSRKALELKKKVKKTEKAD